MILKMGIIGVGRMGIRHIEAINQIDDIKVIGIYDNNISYGEKIAKKYDIKQYYKLENICKSKEIDAISVLSIPTKV